MPSKKNRRKERFRQLRLGVTMDNKLTLVSFVKKKPHPIVHYEADPELFAHLPFPQLSEFEVILALRPPFPILDLPEELVLLILTEAVHTEYQNWRVIPRRKRYKTALSLCLVCKAFRRLVQPLLFLSAIIQLPTQDTPLDGPSNKLYRIIQTNRSLAQHCKDLIIGFPYSWPKDFDAIIQFLSRFVNVNTLRVEGLFDNSVGNGDFSDNNHDLWALLRPILQCMNSVKEFCIWSRCGGFGSGLGLPLHPLCTAMSSIHTPGLTSLRIYGISKRYDHTPFVLPKNLEDAATITSLSISACEETPLSLAEFLKWPSKLEDFSIFDIYWYPNLGYLHDFRSILYRHRASLKSLLIGNVPATGPIDISDFISLESVHLFSRTMSSKWMPEALCDNVLSAPRLCNLIWDFSLYDEQVGPCTSYLDFGSAEAEWLQKVAKIANQRGLALRKIRIIFYPQDSPDVLEDGEKSPWALMEDIGVELESLDMELLIGIDQKW